MRMDRGFKEWEEDLARREKKLSDHDDGMERMMKDLKIREEQIVEKNVEIECCRMRLQRWEGTHVVIVERR